MTTSKKKTEAAPLPSVSQLNKLARTDAEQWQKLIITGGARLPFGSSSSYDTHPLRSYFERQRFGDTDKFIHTEFFVLCAEKLGFIENDRSGDFLSFRNQTIDSMHLYLNPRVGELLRENNLDWYMAKVSVDIQEAVAYSLLDVAEKVACGAPIYRLDSLSNSWILVKDDEQPSAYLLGKRMHREVSRHLSSLPSWVDGHAFRKSDLESLPIFFGDSASELTNDQINARRIAYRAHLGIESRAQVTDQAAPLSSKLMAALRDVRSRYYGPNFSLNDQQTWPKQKDVVAWLKATLSLSEREAEAVDIVARPDALRGKG